MTTPHNVPTIDEDDRIDAAIELWGRVAGSVRFIMTTWPRQAWDGSDPRRMLGLLLVDRHCAPLLDGWKAARKSGALKYLYGCESVPLFPWVFRHVFPHIGHPVQSAGFPDLRTPTGGQTAPP